MREVIIIREKSFMACLAKAQIFIDGQKVGEIKNGATGTFSVDENEHEIYASSPQTKKQILKINSNENDVTLKLKIGLSGFYLTSEEKNSINENNLVETIIPEPLPEKSQAASYICGIIISLLLSGLCIFLYLRSETSLLGLILGLLFSIAVGVTMIAGGFWLVIIPLPYVFVWRVGCLKPNQSIKRKVLLGLFIFVFLVLVFVSLFALSNIG